MVRRGLGAVALLGASLAVGACRDHTVDLGYHPDTGDSYAYRYEIEGTISRALDDEEHEVTELDTVLIVEQEVLERTDQGARVDVALRRDGGDPRRAVVVLDRAGSLQIIEEVEGLAPDPLAGGGPSLVAPSPALPRRPLAPGATWSTDDGERLVRGRLERLGVVDGAMVAVVRATTRDDVREQRAVNGSMTGLVGTVSARVTTTYDLDDGAIRRSVTSSTGRLAVRIAPPAGVAAEPVDGVIDYEVRVRVTRLG